VRDIPAFSSVQEHLIHHGGNAAAVTFPLMAIWLNAPQIISALLGLAGLAWYAALFIDRHRRIKKEKEEGQNVAIQSKHRDNQSDNTASV
jgi:L-lactate permease